MSKRPGSQANISSALDVLERVTASLGVDHESSPALRDGLAELRAVLLDERHRLHARATLGALAAGLAHDIDNPLTSVVGGLRQAVEALAGATEELDSAELLEALRDSLAGAESIARLTRDMQLLAAMDGGRMGPVDLGPLLETAQRLLGTRLRGRIDIEREIDAAPPVWGSEGAFARLLVAVLDRALQDGGAVRVGVRVGHAWVTVEVTTAVAVTEEEDLELGLILRMILELGGTMETTRTTDGSHMLALGFRRALGPSSTSPPRPMRLRVLAIDDEATMLRVIARLLRGHEVVGVQNGERALDLLEAGERFDLVLCDLMMPELTGAELFAVISARFPELADRIGFITGGALTAETAEFLSTTRRPWLTKPFEVDDLRRMVETLAGPDDDETPQGQGQA